MSVVHFTTTFWFFASFLPNSLDDITWYALAEHTVVKIMEETALCVPADSKEVVEIPISELVRI